MISMNPGEKFAAAQALVADAYQMLSRVMLAAERRLLDEEFMAALEFGMPPSVGIALGVERLFMALFDIKTLQDCRAFPRSR